MKLLDWVDRQVTIYIKKSTRVACAGKVGRFHIRSKPEFKVIAGGLAESHIRDAVFAQVRPDDVVYEIGAHIGSWSVFFGLHTPQGQVHVFEPVPHNFDKLKANVQFNELANVDCHQLAMGQTQGKTKFSLPDNEAPVEGNILSYQRTSQPMLTFDVDISTIDLHTASLDRPPTFLKIDCEGAEAMVLRGGQQTLAQSVRVVFLELHDAPLREQGEDPEQLSSPCLISDSKP